MRGTVVDADERVPEGIDPERPSSARMYDYFLGGAHNFAADRQVAEQLIAAYPETPLLAQANRAFLRRAVEFLVDAGVRQFLDIGSGVPTVGHVHEIAQTKAPESRVVFVDVDPVAVEHSRLILAGNDLTGVVQGDVRRPEEILADSEVRRLIDFEQPVAVLVVALFHFIQDADGPADLIARLTKPLVAGSHLVMSHASDDGPQDSAKGRQIYGRAGIDLALRSRRQVEALFAGFEVVEPGVVWVPLWRPESPDDVFVDRPEASTGYAAVGRKP
jgi:hypothetical protein